MPSPSPKRPVGGNIKGAPLRALCEAWTELRGRESLRVAIARLDDVDRGALFSDPDGPGCGVLVSSWYPAVPTGRFVDALFDEIPRHEADALVASLARSVMSQTLSKLHRAVFRLVGSPELMRKRGQLFWNQQWDTGEVVVTEEAPGVQRHVYRNWNAHHPIFCNLSFQCVPVMFEMMGIAPPITAETVGCAADGNPACEAIIRWTP